MPRKYVSTSRFLEPDPRFQSKLAVKFINCLMHQGRKTAARKVFYEAIDSRGRRRCPARSRSRCSATR
jgi:small subunit ribosomal protein S7